MTARHLRRSFLYVPGSEERKLAKAQSLGADAVGIYRGKPIPAGKKSLTLSLQFRDEQGTLQHQTVDGFEKNIVTQLSADLKAELRTV